MNTWRYVQNGQPSEPVDIATLQGLLAKGTLSPDTYVWKEGMVNWVPARSLPEFALCRPAPPPPTVVPPVPSAGSTTSPVPPSLPASEAGDIERNRAVAILAYFGILFLVPLFAAPDSRFAKYHANQGLVLFLTASVLAVGAYVICLMLLFIPILGWLLAAVIGLSLFVGIVALAILGIINAAGGQCKPLPLIGHFQVIK